MSCRSRRSFKHLCAGLSAKLRMGLLLDSRAPLSGPSKFICRSHWASGLGLAFFAKVQPPTPQSDRTMVADTVPIAIQVGLERTIAHHFDDLVDFGVVQNRRLYIGTMELEQLVAM